MSDVRELKDEELTKITGGMSINEFQGVQTGESVCVSFGEYQGMCGTVASFGYDGSTKVIAYVCLEGKNTVPIPAENLERINLK